VDFCTTLYITAPEGCYRNNCAEHSCINWRITGESSQWETVTVKISLWNPTGLVLVMVQLEHVFTFLPPSKSRTKDAVQTERDVLWGTLYTVHVANSAPAQTGIANVSNYARTQLGPRAVLVLLTLQSDDPMDVLSDSRTALFACIYLPASFSLDWRTNLLRLHISKTTDSSLSAWTNNPPYCFIFQPPRVQSWAKNMLSWVLPSSRLLHGVRWFETDVSGPPIDPIFKVNDMKMF
jgi:hypothetical protein